MGDLILSKSTGSEAVLWKPCPQRRKDAVTILRRFPLRDTNIWYLRLDVNDEVGPSVVGPSMHRWRMARLPWVIDMLVVVVVVVVVVVWSCGRGRGRGWLCLLHTQPTKPLTVSIAMPVG